MNLIQVYCDQFVFKSLEELAKHQQKILCGQTDESKCLVY